jgi:hypothetical protein
MTVAPAAKPQAAPAEKAPIVEKPAVAIAPAEVKPASPVAPTPAPVVSAPPVQAPAAPKPAAAAKREPIAEVIPVRRMPEAAPTISPRESAQTTSMTAEMARPVPAAAAPKPSASAIPVVAAARRVEPKIFVPDRAPDDPGPEPAESDDMETPLGRFLSSMKQQTS